MEPSNAEPTTYKLSAEEKQFYEENGYLVIKGLIGPSSLEKLRNRFSQVVKKEVPRGRIAVIEDFELKKKSDNPEDYVNKINHLSHDEGFMSYTEHPRLMDVLTQLIGEEKMIMNSMFINKPPGSPWHPLHQDVYHMPFRPIERILTSWTAIDAADQENGCLFVVPGSHQDNKIHEQEMLPGFVNSLFFAIKDEEVVAAPRVSLPTQPGDTIIMHALTVHGSWANGSQSHRKAITCVYGSGQCEYFDVTGTVQEPFMVEFWKELKRRGLKGTYQEYWAQKSKTIPIRNSEDQLCRNRG